MPSLDLHVNGTARTLEVPDGKPLLSVLREDLGLTGSKIGCGEGECGACTVLVDDVPVRACITPAREAAGKDVLTIEGLEHGGRLHPLQQAFLDAGALQCGYCTPGMIMNTVALLRGTPHPTDAQILDWMNGNLCRCCGYPKILTAVHRAADQVVIGRRLADQLGIHVGDTIRLGTAQRLQTVRGIVPDASGDNSVPAIWSARLCPSSSKRGVSDFDIFSFLRFFVHAAIRNRNACIS